MADGIFKQLAKLALAVLMIVSVGSTSFAQQPPPAQSEERSKPSGGPRRQLATILFTGLGGAVLGLSTLSFYGRPQDELKNIAIGFAFGVIAGTSYVTYKAATGPSDFYGLTHPQIERELASLSERQTAPQGFSPGAPLSLGLNFEF